MQATRRQAYAANTHKNLLVQWRSFIMFCLYYDLECLPAETETLSLYAQFLSRSFKTVAAITNYISGVRLLHLYVGVSPPDLSDFSFKLVLSGLRRVKLHRVKQAAPMTPKILLAMYHYIMQDPEGPTIWALFLVAFYLFLRKSNLVPLTPRAFDSTKQLCRKDIVVGQDVVLVRIRLSKTIQFGDRVLKLPLLPVPGSVLCPVSAVKNMLNDRPTRWGDQPAFALLSGGQYVPITYLRYQQYLRKFLDLAGFQSARFSSHSFRRGGATFAFQSGVPSYLVKLQGDWRSDAYTRYLDVSVLDRAAVFRAMALNLDNVL